jgi:hypothetical protein
MNWDGEGLGGLENEIALYRATSKAQRGASGLMGFVNERKTKCIDAGHNVLRLSWLKWDGDRFRMLSCAECGALHRIETRKATPTPPPVQRNTRFPPWSPPLDPGDLIA